MTKRIILVHGWGGSPEGDWFPWAKKEFEKRGYKVEVPAMPDSDNPQIELWVKTLAGVAGKAEGNTNFIGHSIGCQTILRYLETLPEGQKASKVVLVAPWTTLYPESIPAEEDKEISKPWIETPINFDKVRGQANSFVTIFSDNDPDVPLEENKKIFEEKLGVKTVIEKNMGHFNEGSGVRELPLLLSFF